MEIKGSLIFLFTLIFLTIINPVIAEPEKEIISTQSVNSSFDPVIAIDSKDSIHVVWQEHIEYHNDSDIYYSMFDDRIQKISQYWSPPLLLSIDNGNYSDGVEIVVDSMDNLHVFWHEESAVFEGVTYHEIIYRMHNSSNQVWEKSKIIFTGSDRNSKPYFYTIAIDSFDNIHLLWTHRIIENTILLDELRYAKLNSKTREWSEIEVITSDSDSPSSYNSIAIDSESNVHVVWSNTVYKTDFLSLEVMYMNFQTSTNSWSNAIHVSKDDEIFSFDPQIAIDTQDTVHIVWTEGTIINEEVVTNDELDVIHGEIMYRNYILKKDSWSTPEIVSSRDQIIGDRNRGNPEIAIDSEGNIHIIWVDPSASNPADYDNALFYRRYSPLSQTWTTATILTHFISGHRHSPSLAIDADDSLHIAWADKSETIIRNIFYTKYLSEEISALSSTKKASSFYFNITFFTLSVITIAIKRYSESKFKPYEF